MVRFHHITQNGGLFETHELFVSGIFHLVISITVAHVAETEDKGGLLYTSQLLVAPT